MPGLLSPDVSAPHHLIIKARQCWQWQIHVTPRIIPLQFQISVSPHHGASTPWITIKIYTHHDRTCHGIWKCEAMSQQNTQNFKTVTVWYWKELLWPYPGPLCRCALNGVVCVRGRGTMRLDHVMVSIMNKSCELPQIIADRLLLCLGPDIGVTLALWRIDMTLTWHWTLDSLFCITQCLTAPFLTLDFYQNSNPVQTKLPFL